MKYYTINEEAAARAKEMYSFLSTNTVQKQQNINRKWVKHIATPKRCRKK